MSVWGSNYIVFGDEGASSCQMVDIVVLKKMLCTCLPAHKLARQQTIHLDACVHMLNGLQIVEPAMRKSYMHSGSDSHFTERPMYCCLSNLLLCNSCPSR